MKKLCTVLLLIMLSFTLASCDEFGIDNEVGIGSVTLNADSIMESYEVGTFTLTDIQIQVMYDDATFEYIQVTESMISTSDLEKLNTVGTHTIEIIYSGIKTPITINITDSVYVQSELTIKLMSIYQKASDAGSIEDMTYEQWLESITGPQGETGKEVLLQVAAGYIQWKYTGDTSWTNLIDLEALVGPRGADGLSAYDIYARNYPDYTGTETQWLNDLINNNLIVTNKHVVTFKALNGTNDMVVNILHGELIQTRPETPVMYGYDFEGWYYEDEEWSFIGYSVHYDITLEAKWTAVPGLPHLASYPNGVNLSILDIEDRDILFAALERYQLENVYSGVPLYNNASYSIFSSRTDLYSPDYNGYFGFGTEYSQLTEDDSTVLMSEGVYGNSGEYTWRDAYQDDPSTLNPWLADDSNSTDWINKFTGSLYEIRFDDSKTGIQIEPSLASTDPTPEVGTDSMIDGTTQSKVWLIDLRDDLEWTFHSDIDLTNFATGYEKLDASDYLYTWQLALDNSWFRAVLGGGDFVSLGVKNAEEYVDGTMTDFNQVGLSVVNGNTIRIEFETIKSEYDVKYMFTRGTFSPINQELYESLDITGYGSNPLTTASSGAYVLDVWEEDQLLSFVKNDNYADADLYHYTGLQYCYIEVVNAIFNEFIEGRLDVASIPKEYLSDYMNHPNAEVAPGNTTWRLVMNSFGTEDARDTFIIDNPKLGINDSFIPEPILMYTEMRQSMYYGFERDNDNAEIVKAYVPQHTLFTSTYFLDGESGVTVRTLDAGKAVYDDFFEGNYGFNRTKAIDLFKEAVAKGIEDGYYIAGTENEYTIITLELTYASSGNESFQAMAAEIKEQYEALLVDDTNFVKVVIIVNDRTFPDNYYSYMMTANFDIGLGGISGNILDAPGFLNIFNDNNSSGFTINWGIDTSSANITVQYHNLNGFEVTEIWSYNALVAALNETTCIKDGLIQDAWYSPTALIQGYMYMENVTGFSLMTDTEYAPIILGESLETLAAAEGYDALVSYVVIKDSGENYLYVIARDGNEYSKYSVHILQTDVETAMSAHSGGYTLTDYYLIVDDAAVVANEHLASLGYETLAAIAEGVGISPEFMEVYATSWDVGSTWNDAYVVLHINDYYIPLKWL